MLKQCALLVILLIFVAGVKHVKCDREEDDNDEEDNERDGDEGMDTDDEDNEREDDDDDDDHGDNDDDEHGTKNNCELRRRESPTEKSCKFAFDVCVCVLRMRCNVFISNHSFKHVSLVSSLLIVLS